MKQQQIFRVRPSTDVVIDRNLAADSRPIEFVDGWRLIV